MQPPPSLLMLEQYCLCIAPIYANDASSLQALEIVSSCCKHTLLASHP
jgi:hypothetical protein